MCVALLSTGHTTVQYSTVPYRTVHTVFIGKGRCNAVQMVLGCCGQAGFRTDCLQISIDTGGLGRDVHVCTLHRVQYVISVQAVQSSTVLDVGMYLDCTVL